MASSAVVKFAAVVCLLALVMASAAEARPADHDAAMLRLEMEVEEQALAAAEDLLAAGLLDDGGADAVGACSCGSKCKACMVKCGVKCVKGGIPRFPSCFVKCVFTTDKCLTLP
ncbi:uncharacterized protein LOC102700268 [Oryza brachyantha]|uniref:Uncharacterized protein n=1 Tax=Oryza brachyantha TaxID=4533 RepID=J3MXC2_ORYBR|nr:uncharacterized protein LOC102700268 [Oryza brachyantha]